MSDSIVDIRYRDLRELINKRYNMLDIVKEYRPNSTERETRMPSFVIDYGDSMSMVIDYHEKRWKCYASGKGGGYMELLYHTKRNRENSKLRITEMADNILRKDVTLQKVLGYKTIFSSETEVKVDINLRQSTRFRDTKDVIEYSPNKVTFSRIVKQLSAQDNLDSLFNLLSDFEKGMPEKDLIDKYKDASKGIFRKSELEELNCIFDSILSGSD